MPIENQNDNKVDKVNETKDGSTKETDKNVTRNADNLNNNIEDNKINVDQEHILLSKQRATPTQMSWTRKKHR